MRLLGRRSGSPCRPSTLSFRWAKGRPPSGLSHNSSQHNQRRSNDDRQLFGAELDAAAAPSPQALEISTGDIGALSRRARAAASAVIACTWRSAPRPTYRSRGRSRRPPMQETPTVAPLLDKLKGFGFSPRGRAMDKDYDNTTVYDACEDRDVSPIVSLRKPRESRKAGTSRRAASTESGGSPGLTTTGRPRSGAVRRASASPPRCGSRATGCSP